MTTKKSTMLPPVWKTVGFTVAAVAIVVGVGLAVFAPETWHNVRAVFKGEYLLSLAIAGLFVAAMSRDRREDEMLIRMRLASIFHAFCWITAYVVIYPFLAALLKMPMIGAQAAILSMLCFYHMNFIISKWTVRKDAKEKHDHENE